ncbi:uncharacterized protein [Prorops nasuta]|uniref:uncharacterized protein isoform X1 n=1 Tax=Prorops nasuta TaxID=863751 RepID=UPI0034CF9410
MSDNASSDSSREAEEKQLLTDVRLLKSLFIKAKDALYSKNCYIEFGKVLTSLSKSTFSLPQSRILNKATEIKMELFHYTGLSCKKFKGSNYVLEFNCNNETFVVEIIKTKEMWTIGKWFMPPSIDMKQLISQYSLNEFTSLLTFLKHLKFHIECYKERTTNFKKLQNITENLSNFECSANNGLTQITLEFFQVYSVEEDLNIDINVHLIYKPEELIPKEIQIESVLPKKLSDTTEEKLKSIMKILQMQNLAEAFQQIFHDQELFVWPVEENEIITNVLNSSKEDSNVNLQTRLKHKLTRRKKQKQGKRLKHLERISNYDEEPSTSSGTRSLNKNRLKDIKKNAYRQSNNKTINNSLSKISVSPILNVSQLKQTKLKFINNSKSSTKSVKSKNMNKIVTSTPLHLTSKL